MGSDAGPDASSPPRAPLRVMTFNVRVGGAADGDNHWRHRRELLFEVVRDSGADLVGLQEAEPFQVAEIAAAAPAYAVIGIGRNADGGGEGCQILLRRDRLRVAETGTFWFCETPSVPGTMAWGARYPRICTWARLVDRDGGRLWLYNLHLDHESEAARANGVALLRRRIAERPAPAEPAIIIGDFNAEEDDPAVRALLDGAEPRFIDAFRATQPDASPAGTFTSFVHGRLDGPHIDYVLVPPRSRVLSAEIVRTARDGRYPSDHFPVVADVLLPDAG
jgi:endonuclease/exonuclease/phosphatase family metal-dependent hydrolase